MAATLSSVRDIERELASLRVAPDSSAPYQRTSVMTHIAWVPEQWVEAAEDVLAGLAERHPSRTIVLVPDPDDDGLEASVEVQCFPVGEGREICTETIRIRLGGTAATVPASVVQPLLIPDLPVFLRWRGLPPFGEDHFEVREPTMGVSGKYTFSELLKQFRVREGVTQRELGENLAVHRNRIGAWERGDGFPKIPTATSHRWLECTAGTQAYATWPSK